MNHRKPPLPKSFYANRPGYCRWCGKPVLKEDGTINRRRHWHRKSDNTNCLAEYFFVTRPQYARMVVRQRDKKVCAKCGRKDPHWQLDHIVPLKDAPRELKYWGLSNAQTLCRECHKLKTASESAKRARRRK